jgi:hypothetical protein
MSVVLETDRDRSVEERVMTRIVTELRVDATPIRLPRMAACDFLLDYGGEIRVGLEIKSRKETVDTIRGYGGLMLKHRKLVELQDIGRMMALKMVIAFAFEDGRGPVLIADPALIIDVDPVAPPTRRNYRGLACDEEPVVFLDWDQHLKRIL